MYVSVPPRFGVSAAAAGQAIAATQSAAPKAAAANPDVLITAFLRRCWSGSFSDATHHGRGNARLDTI
jgi:hypothetical protein